MTRTFAEIKTAAETATTPVELYRAVKEAGDKYQRNVQKVQFMSFQHGRAADADHYFQNVLPVWNAVVNEINAIWTKAVTGKPTEEIVSIMVEGGA